MHLFLERWVYRAICWGKHRDSWERIMKMDRLESEFRRLRSYFGDGARLYFPWGHPDD